MLLFWLQFLNHKNTQNVLHRCSISAPFSRQSGTTVDNELKSYKQKNHLRINVLNGFSWSFDVFQNGAQERT